MKRPSRSPSSTREPLAGSAQVSTKPNERLVRVWLKGMAASGYAAYDEEPGYFIHDWQEMRDQVRQMIMKDDRYKAIEAGKGVTLK